MMRRAVALVASALILSGCAPVHRINPVVSEREREDLNRTLQGRRVSVELAGSMSHEPGVKLRAESVCVAADSTSMTLLREPADITALIGEPAYRVRRDTTLSTCAIRTVSFRSSWPGATQGLLRGFLTGAAAGAVLGVATFRGADLITGSRIEAAGLGAAVVGLAGAGVGLIGGLIRGGTEVYEFAETRPDSSVSSSR